MQHRQGSSALQESCAKKCPRNCCAMHWHPKGSLWMCSQPLHRLPRAVQAMARQLCAIAAIAANDHLVRIDPRDHGPSCARYKLQPHGRSVTNNNRRLFSVRKSTVAIGTQTTQSHLTHRYNLPRLARTARVVEKTIKVFVPSHSSITNCFFLPPMWLLLFSVSILDCFSAKGLYCSRGYRHAGAFALPRFSHQPVSIGTDAQNTSRCIQNEFGSSPNTYRT